VHGHLTPSLWACGDAEHHGGEGIVEQSCSRHGSWDAERERKRRGLMTKTGPSDLISPVSPHLLTAHSAVNSSVG
jgi:hypothetical protein